MKSYQKLIKVLLIILILPILLKAQKNNLEDYMHPFFEVNFAPLGLIDPSHPQFRLGAEYFILKHLSAELDLGYGFTAWYKLVGGSQFTKYHYYQLRPNVRFYVHDNKHFKIYIAPEFFYMREKDVAENVTINVLQAYADYGILTVDRCNYKRWKYGGNLNFGFKFYTNRALFFEIYGGGGVYKKYAEAYNIAKGSFYPFAKAYFQTADLNEGYNSFINITGGFKIGFVIFDWRYSTIK